MSQSDHHLPNIVSPNWGAYQIWFGIFVGLAAFYALVFALTETLILPRDIALWSICNALPHVAFAVPLVNRIAPQMHGRSPMLTLAMGAGAVSGYAIVAYCGAIFLLVITGGVRSDGMFVRFFSGPALPWQMFQGSAYGCAAIAAGLWIDTRKRLRELENRNRMRRKCRNAGW